MTQPRSIWISAEHWASGEWNPASDAVDVLVTLDNGARWSATFLTVAYLQMLMDRYRSSGECLGGRYAWLAEPIFVDAVTRPAIEAVIEDLLETWQAGYRPPFEGIKVFGHRWSLASHQLRDFLARNQVP